ncbi:hypothetical protein KCV07_g403, partial [Aureobasidium melanogenum]
MCYTLSRRSANCSLLAGGTNADTCLLAMTLGLIVESSVILKTSGSTEAASICDWTSKRIVDSMRDAVQKWLVGVSGVPQGASQDAEGGMELMCQCVGGCRRGRQVDDELMETWTETGSEDGETIKEEKGKRRPYPPGAKRVFSRILLANLMASAQTLSHLAASFSRPS